MLNETRDIHYNEGKMMKLSNENFFRRILMQEFHSFEWIQKLIVASKHSKQVFFVHVTT